MAELSSGTGDDQYWTFRHDGTTSVIVTETSGALSEARVDAMRLYRKER